MKNTVGLVQDLLIDTIEQVIVNAKQKESYLFIGKSYDIAFNKAYEKLCFTNPIDIYNVQDKDFNIDELINCCVGRQSMYVDGRIVALRLKNKAKDYQTKLLVPLERLNIPLVIFVDNDNLLDTFMSRFEHERIYKAPNENLSATVFIPPHKALHRVYTDISFACPSLVKLGDYNKLSPSEKNMDMAISKLSNGNVYPEVLLDVQPPIKTFDDDVKLEALSLLKKRFDMGVQV